MKVVIGYCLAGLTAAAYLIREVPYNLFFKKNIY